MGTSSFSIRLVHFVCYCLRSSPRTVMATENVKSEPTKTKIDLGLLEEDDEFEEFPADDWTEKEEDADDVNVWEDNWDDDNVEDDFSQQLRAALEKQGIKMEQ